MFICYWLTFHAPGNFISAFVSNLCSLEPSPFNSILPSIQHTSHLFFPAKTDFFYPYCWMSWASFGFEGAHSKARFLLDSSDADSS